MNKIVDFFKRSQTCDSSAREFLKYLGPGFLVTIGFIDPGNWASNIAAGSEFGYSLLWIVTLGTIFLIVLQHNSAHLGIATGFCLSEAATIFLKPWISRIILITAMIAVISTAFAEILGAAIAINMLFKLPVFIGSILVTALILWMLITNSYKKLETWIIGFVSIIGLSVLLELLMVNVEWGRALEGCFMPTIPNSSMFMLMSVLGAVVMPHNLFLHSEVIQSRKWNLKDENIIQKQLKYEFMDTILSMIVGWIINVALIILAAATFFQNGFHVEELSQAQQMLVPLAGNRASIIFAIALLFSGISAALTASMAGGSISAGIFGRPYNICEHHTKYGIWITLIVSLAMTFLVKDILSGLVYSQMILSIQLPFTIFLQIYLTSSKKIMGKFKNSSLDKAILWIIGGIVILLNILLLFASF